MHGWTVVIQIHTLEGYILSYLKWCHNSKGECINAYI